MFAIVPPPPTAAAPPTSPGLLPPPPEQWPKVVGVLCIVVGALGVLAHVWGAVSTLLLEAFFPTSGELVGVIDAIRPYQPWLLAQYLVAASLAVLLVIGGVGLTGRRVWSGRVLQVWAVLRFLVVPAGAVLQYLMQRAQFEAMSQDPRFNTAPALTGGMMEAMALFSVVFALALGWSQPVFILIWLRRPSVRTAMERW